MFQAEKYVLRLVREDWPNRMVMFCGPGKKSAAGAEGLPIWRQMPFSGHRILNYDRVHP